MKLPYFNLGDAISEIKTEFSYGSIKDRAASVAKLAGKTAVNAGLLVVDVGVHAAKEAPAYFGRSAEKRLKEDSSLSDDQRSKLGDIAEWGRRSEVTRDRERAEEKESHENASSTASLRPGWNEEKLRTAHGVKEIFDVVYSHVQRKLVKQPTASLGSRKINVPVEGFSLTSLDSTGVVIGAVTINSVLVQFRDRTVELVPSCRRSARETMKSVWFIDIYVDKAEQCGGQWLIDVEKKGIRHVGWDQSEKLDAGLRIIMGDWLEN